MSVLQDIDPAIRKKVYQGFALVSLALGAAQVGFGAAGAETPTWLTVELAVFAFVAGAVGFTAQSNTNEPDYEWSGSDVPADDTPEEYRDAV